MSNRPNRCETSLKKSCHVSGSLTHVESDRDDVQRHGGVCDAAER